MKNQKNKIMKIRGHHLLCMQSFKGFGYNQTFVDNMYKVIGAIKNNDNLFLHIVAECDALCLHCPHSINNRTNNRNILVCAKDADSEIELREMDLNVLDKFNLTAGTIIKASEIFKFIRKEINKDNNVFTICGSCKWIEICINEHKRI
ncbi:MAG: hypothetical protein COA82_08350 [Alkaliphilus sp.]|nr:MAG: hypothetical protein COA82_08350 [Alkaliphilus sp.]